MTDHERLERLKQKTQWYRLPSTQAVVLSGEEWDGLRDDLRWAATYIEELEKELQKYRDADSVLLPCNGVRDDHRDAVVEDIVDKVIQRMNIALSQKKEANDD